MFTGHYCPNHCDLPADKKAAAKKKDEEIRASAKPNPTPGSVAAPVSAPVYQLTNCHGLCGKPPNYVWRSTGGYYCNNPVGLYGTCGAGKPIDFTAIGKATSNTSNSWNLSGSPTFTINWGGQPIDVISDPDCPSGVIQFRGANFANPVTIALKKPYPDLGRASRSQFQCDGVVPGPEVRADSSPPWENWRRDYPESHSSAHDGYTDWHQAVNRAVLEHYRR